jgi:hypothetical protein
MVRAGVPCKTIQVVLKTGTVSGPNIRLAGNGIVGKELPSGLQTRNLPTQNLISFGSGARIAKIDVRNNASKLISQRAHKRAELSRLPKSLIIVDGATLEIVEDQPAVSTHMAKTGCLTAARKTRYQHNLLNHRTE